MLIYNLFDEGSIVRKSTQTKRKIDLYAIQEAIKVSANVFGYTIIFHQQLAIVANIEQAPLCVLIHIYTDRITALQQMEASVARPIVAAEAKKEDVPNLAIFYSIKIILTYITMNCGCCAALLCTFKRKTSPHSSL